MELLLKTFLRLLSFIPFNFQMFLGKLLGKLLYKALKKRRKVVIWNIHKCFPDMNKKLFRDLGEHENFQNSMRPFYSMPNTSLPNDQKSFTDYCYGDMHSKKEDVDILNEDRF